MDWTTIIVSCIPAIVASTISFFTARHQSKTELKKAAQENSAAIDRLMKQHEIDIESLCEQHKMEMDTKEKDHQHKLELMQREYELKVAESKTAKNDDITASAAAGFFQLFMQNPTEGTKTLEALKNLRDSFNTNK